MTKEEKEFFIAHIAKLQREILALKEPTFKDWELNREEQNAIYFLNRELSDHLASNS